MDPVGPNIALPHPGQRRSGLFVPSDLARAHGGRRPDAHEKTLYIIGRIPEDTDTVVASIDPEALDLSAIGLDEITELLHGVRFEPAIAVVGALAGEVWHAGRDQGSHSRLAQIVFEDRPILARIERFLREDPNHVVFNEQHLTVLVRLLVEHAAEGGGRDGLTEDEYGLLLQALLGVSGLCGDHGGAAEDDEGTAWATWLVRNGLYFDRTNLGSDEGRALALLVERGGAADRATANWCDLARWMAEDVAPFADQLAFGTAMAGFTKIIDENVVLAERKIGVVLDGLLGGRMPPELLDRLVASCSATRDELRAALGRDGMALDHILWDRTAFERRPFVRTGDGRLVLLGPRFLFSWMGEGFYYRLLDAAMRRPDPDRPQKPATLRFTRFHGELMERYVVDVAHAAHAAQARAGSVRIAGEMPYIGCDKTESMSPDLVLDFGTDLVTVEVTGGRLPRRARILSEPAVMREVLDKKIIRKLIELDKATTDLLDGCVNLDGLALALVERVWPVVVVPSTILQGDVTWSYIHDRAPGLFSGHPALQPPTLLAIDDFEALMGIVEAGNGLPAVLAARLASPFRRMPPSHFFSQRYPNSKRPALLEDALKRAAKMARDALFSRAA